MIEARGLVKDFQDKKRGKIRAVDHVSFTCKPGQIYGLLGANGAGKTTTLRMLATILEPTRRHRRRLRPRCDRRSGKGSRLRGIPFDRDCALSPANFTGNGRIFRPAQRPGRSHAEETSGRHLLHGWT